MNVNRKLGLLKKTGAFIMLSYVMEEKNFSVWLTQENILGNHWRF